MKKLFVKSTLLLTASLLGMAVCASSISNQSSVRDYYLDNLVQRVTLVQGPDCDNYSEDERVDIAVEALNIVTDSYLKERTKFDNSNMVNERDMLVTHIETPFLPSCASIRGEYKEGFKEHTLSSAAFDFKYVERLLN